VYQAMSCCELPLPCHKCEAYLNQTLNPALHLCKEGCSIHPYNAQQGPACLRLHRNNTVLLPANPRQLKQPDRLTIHASYKLLPSLQHQDQQR